MSANFRPKATISHFPIPENSEAIARLISVLAPEDLRAQRARLILNMEMEAENLLQLCKFAETGQPVKSDSAYSKLLASMELLAKSAKLYGQVVQKL